MAKTIEERFHLAVDIACFERWQKEFGREGVGRKQLWCNSHQRRAERCKIEGGILLPCYVVDLTGIAEIVYTERRPRKNAGGS